MVKTVLVTGAAGGMGRSICARLLRSGYEVWGLDRRNEGCPGGVRFISCDVTEPASVAAALERLLPRLTVEDMQHINTLVQNIVDGE
jgi:NAD(P)-dependent dehydrogenase (short-subunit alcohol dehydrogenase family)